MNTAAKKIEVAANLAIILLALLLGAVVVRNYLWPGRPADSSDRRRQETIRPGERLALPGVEWAQNGRTLVVVLSKDCRFCTESAAFYRRLVEGSRDKKLKVIAVLPQDVKTGQEYVNGLGVAFDEIRQASLGSLQVRGTPTLLLVGGGGEVQEVWVGKLPAERESEVLNKILA